MTKTCGDCHYYTNSQMHGPWCLKNRKEVSYLQTAYDCFTEPGTAPSEPVQTKVCSHCGRELPIAKFGRHSRTKDGYQPCCRECLSEMNKGHRKRQPFEHNEKPAKPEEFTPEQMGIGKGRRSAHPNYVDKDTGLTMKWCKHCGQYKPIDEFHHNKANKDGHEFDCKVCRGARLAEYNRRKAEERKARGPKAAHPAYVDETTGVTMRWCGCCQQYKPETEFARDASNKSGFATQCKACRVVRETERRRRLREAKKEALSGGVPATEPETVETILPDAALACPRPDLTVVEASDEQLAGELRRRGWEGVLVKQTSLTL